MSKILRSLKKVKFKIVVKITIPIGIILLLLFYIVPRNNNSLAIGDHVIVQNAVALDGGKGIRLREIYGKGIDEIGWVFNGATGTIIGGPEPADDYRWWEVQWDVGQGADKISWLPNHSDKHLSYKAWIAEKINGIVVLAKKN